MPRILSFDVGIRHLAYCLMTHEGWDEKSSKILQWDVIDLGQVSSVEMCASRLMEELEKLFSDVCVDVVLVERQPKSRSIIMVAVQMFLCSYFSLAKLHGRVRNVKFISAQRKLGMKWLPPVREDVDVPGKKKNQYAENKKYAIAVSRHYLEHVIHDFGNLVLLDMYAKKDDLCDSFLQGVAYVEGQGKCSRIPYAHSSRGGKRPKRPMAN